MLRSLVLLAIIVALAIGATAGLVPRVSLARGPEGVDLQGEWSIELGGEEPIICEATFEHLPLREPFDISIECPGYGPKVNDFFARIDLDTNEVVASIQFYPPAPPAHSISLQGVLAEDGQSISGTWHNTYEPEPELYPFTATRIGPLVSPLPTLPVPVDLTGTWHFELTGDTFDLNCNAVIQHKGVAIQGAADCTVFGWMDFGRTRFDATTGEFDITLYGWAANFLELDGFAEDSDVITGSWTAIGGYNGTFTATRADVEYHDISGEWEGLLLDSGDICDITFTQDLLLLDAILDCGALGAGDFSGGIDPIEGSFSLTGSLSDLEVSIYGRTSTDAAEIVGTMHQGFEQSWPLIFVPAGQLEHGIIGISCYPERERGYWNWCFGTEGEAQEIVIELLLAPSGLPQRVDFALEYPTDLAAYHPTADPSAEAAQERCTDVERTVAEGRATFSCLIPGGADRGPLLTLTISCERAVRIAPWIPWLYLLPVDNGPAPTLIAGAILPCGDPPRQPITSDTNCDGEVNSIDVTLLLQHIAGLIDSFACDVFLDLNFDGQVNSIDATILLQWIAGLLGPPP